MFSTHMAAYSATSIWFDVAWFAFVLIISPALFLLTMAISELPVMLARRITQMLQRAKFDPIQF